MKLPLIEVTIRRDMSTTTPVTVPPHEIVVLREIFGSENVHSENPVSTVEIDADGEFERLCAKYDYEQISKVFGNGGLLLKQHIEASEIKRSPGRPPKD